jgi:hypothetical protein
MRGGDAGRYTAHRAVSNGQKAAFAKVAKKAPHDARVHDTEEKNPAGLPRGQRGSFPEKIDTMPIPISALARNFSINVASTGNSPVQSREYWRIEAEVAGSDWPSLVALHCSIID